MNSTTNSQVAPEDELNLNTNVDFGNFDAEELEIEETVNVTLLFDTSSSMYSNAAFLNAEIKMMIETCQNWHHAPKIFWSMGHFDSSIEVLTGFQPVANVKIPTFTPDGGSTRLYDACLEFLKNVINQHISSRKAGVKTKSIFFVLTDGADNASNYDSAKEVKKMIDFMLTDEKMIGTFGSVMCGIGNPTTFENAQKAMGIQKLFVIDSNLSDHENMKKFKEVFEFLSQSISSASSTPGALMNF